MENYELNSRSHGGMDVYYGGFPSDFIFLPPVYYTILPPPPMKVPSFPIQIAIDHIPGEVWNKDSLFFYCVVPPPPRTVQ